MSENLDFNNIKSDDLPLDTEDSDYKNLIAKLKEIEKTIAFLEKTVF